MASGVYEIDDRLARWIEDHQSDDPIKLRLKVHGDPRLEFAVTQIECRRRCSRKLPGCVSNPRFVFPSTLACEQSSSEALATFHSTLVSPGSRVADLTAGLGIDTFVMSRKARSVTAIEIDPLKAEALALNCRVLGIENIDVAAADCIEWLASASPRSFDTIFIDPARRAEDGGRLFRLTDCSPDVVRLMPRMLEVASTVIVKASPMLDVTQTMRDVPGCRVVIAGTRKECKELVLVVGEDVTPGVETVTIDADKRPVLDADTVASSESDSAFLCEPWPAEMKHPAIGMLGQRYGIRQIGPDSHLFLSSRPVSDFPGEIYPVEAIYPFSRRGISAVRSRFPAASVASRGIGLNAVELRRRLGVAEGDKFKIFGVKNAENQRQLIVCRLIS